MREYKVETEKKVRLISDILDCACVNEILYENSDGKDGALVGILCKMACDNTIGPIISCGSKQNYETNKSDAEAIAKQFDIFTRVVDLSDVKKHTQKGVYYRKIL